MNEITTMCVDCDGSGLEGWADVDPNRLGAIDELDDCRECGGAGQVDVVEVGR